MKKKVGIVGNGSWGTTIAKIVAQNLQKDSNRLIYDSRLLLWGIEEEFEGKYLVTSINIEHMNKKYLDDIRLPSNIQATSDISVLTDVDIVIFALPHQFIRTINSFNNIFRRDCIGLTVIKGFINNDDGSINLISDYISQVLSIRVNVLMGANIALFVANEEISEGTLGYTDEECRDMLFPLLNCYYYRVSCIKDIYGVELSGCLKNIVALGVGVVEGLGYHSNTKVAIIRNGILEIRKFIRYFFPSSLDETIFESCGMADLLTSCMEGRNYKYGLEKARKGISLEDFEKSIGNQKIQGLGTTEAIYKFLVLKKKTDEYPVFVKIYKIFFENEFLGCILDTISSDSFKMLQNKV